MPYRRRLRRDAPRPYDRTTVSVLGLDAARNNDALADYLASANIVITALAEHQALRAQITHFTNMTFVHVALPQATVVWPRDRMSLDRGLIMICRSGGLDVESEDAVIRRGPGLIVIPPGDGLVTFRALAPLNEILYISVNAALMADVVTSHPEVADLPAVATGALAPLFAFGATVCSISVDDPGAVWPLQSAAIEVVRTLLRLVHEVSPTEMTLFTRAMQVIVADYPRTRLSGASIARILGCSERTLQAAFTREGSTLVKEIRAVRARAAVAIRERDPRMTAAEVSAIVGFGSASAMFRALREVAQSERSGG